MTRGQIASRTVSASDTCVTTRAEVSATLTKRDFVGPFKLHGRLRLSFVVFVLIVLNLLLGFLVLLEKQPKHLI